MRAQVMRMEPGPPRGRWSRRVHLWVVSLIGVLSLIWSVVSFLGTQDAADVGKRMADWKERAERLAMMVAGRVTELTQSLKLGDRHACIQRAQMQFGRTVHRIIATAVPRHGVNDYVMAPEPKAFALCINWALARPDSQVTRAWGFATGRTAPEERAAISGAIAHCSAAQARGAEDCTCQVVSRNGVARIEFPEQWSGGRCW